MSMQRAHPFPRDEAVALVRRIPAYGLLAFQLSRDPTLAPGRRRALIAGAAYLLSPIDVVPGIIPLAGQLDDLIVIIAALRYALGGMTPEQRARRLEAVGLSEAVLAADERTLVEIAAWGGRAALRIGHRISEVTLEVGSRTGRLLAEAGARIGRRMTDAGADAGRAGLGRLRARMTRRSPESASDPAD